ncbi:hypothetical protein N7G274_009475 [Stereocaulon virgatum]|uniref:C2H2-type domain-containing protein n=1 Tax=Stereocaulon virgatum TaxID=373712 RepID=A0ABR3ZX56_9LECA
MANANDMRCGRPSFPIRHTFHGYGPSTNGPIIYSPSYPAIYEGYLFIPSEHSPFEDRWTRARPMKLPVSQDDLYDQVAKQRKSGITATEELCSLRVNNAKRAMIYKLIHERSMSESGSTYELVALKLERDYVQVEEPENGKTYNRKHDSKHKTSRRRRKRTVSVYVVLQCPVRRASDVTPTQSLNALERSSGAYAIGRNNRALSKFESGTVPNTARSTPRLEYLPSYARPRDATRNDNASDTQNVNRQIDWESHYGRRQLVPPPARSDGKVENQGPPISSSTRSVDVAKPTTPRMPMATQHYNDDLPVQDLSRKSIDQNESRPRSVDAWPEHATLTRSNMGSPSQTKGKQQSLVPEAQKIQPLSVCPPCVSKSDESPTRVAVVHSFEDGRCVVMNEFAGHMRSLGSNEKSREIMEADIQSLSSTSTSEDDCTSMTPSLDGDDCLRGLDQPKLDGHAVSEQKPAWMDNMVPVTLPSATEDYIESVHHKTDKESPNANESSQTHSPREAKFAATVEDEHVKPEESGYHTSHSDEPIVITPGPSSSHTDASKHFLEAKGQPSSSVGQSVPVTQNTNQSFINVHKSSKGTNHDYFSRPPSSSESLVHAQKLTAEVNHAADFRAASDNTTKGTNNTHDNNFHSRDLSPSMSKPGSYERLRPQESLSDPPTTATRQPAGIRKIFAIKPDNDLRKSSSTSRKSVKFSEPLAPSSPLYTPTSSDVSSSETPPRYPQSQSVSPPSEPHHTISRSANRPPLARRSDHLSTVSPAPISSHDNSWPSRSSTTSTVRARTGRQGFNDYDTCSWDSSSSDDDGGTGTQYVYLCRYRNCNRYAGVPFSSRKEMRAHMRTVHPDRPRGG